jgi:signal transduction histidine kinase
VPEKFAAGHSRHRADYAKNPHARTMGAGRDLHAKRKDGSVFPIEISLSPFSMDDEQYIMSFMVDISKRKEQEEQLKKLTEEYRLLNTELEKRVVERTEELADAINKLASSKREIMNALEKEKELNELKSRFVTMASHEFRTPLSTILSSVSLIGK